MAFKTKTRRKQKQKKEQERKKDWGECTNASSHKYLSSNQAEAFNQVDPKVAIAK